MIPSFTKSAEDVFNMFGSNVTSMGGCGSCNSMSGGKRKRKQKTKKRKTRGKRTYKRRGRTMGRRRRRKRRGGTSVSYQATPVGINSSNSALANPMQISKN